MSDLRERVAELAWRKGADMVGLGSMSEWADIDDYYRNDWRALADDMLRCVIEALAAEAETGEREHNYDCHGCEINKDIARWLRERLAINAEATDGD